MRKDEIVLKNVINDFIDNNEMTKSNNFIAIKYYDCFGITEKLISDIVYEKSNYYYYYHEFNCNKIISAFEPILDWIKYVVFEKKFKTLEELLDNCISLETHKYIFESYLNKGIGNKKEVTLFGEIEFEKGVLIEELISMMKFLSKDNPVVFVFNKFHAVCSSTLHLIDELYNTYFDNIKVIITFNESVNVLNYVQKDWKRFFSKIHVMSTIYDWDDNEDVEHNSEVNIIKFSTNKLARYFKKINNMIGFLEYRQAKYYLGLLYNKYEVEKYNIRLTDRFELLGMYIIASINNKDLSDAYVALNIMKKLIDNQDREYHYRILKGYLLISMEKYEQAKKNLTIAKNIAKIEENERKIFTTEISMQTANYSNWTGVVYYDDLKSEKQYLIEQCKKFGYLNFLAHIYIYAFDNNTSLYRTIDSVKNNLTNFYKGIEIAQKLGNKKLILEGHKKALLIASSIGMNKVSSYIYKEKCLPLALSMTDIIEEANCYNGLGYDASIGERYVEANDYYNKALKIYYKEQNIEFLGETLYNMSINAMLAEDYHNADVFITTQLYIIENQRTDSRIRVCHIAKLRGIKAYCCYMLGNIYECKNNVKMIGQLIEYVLKSDNERHFYYWNDDLLFYYFVSGLLLMKKGRYEEAECNFENAHVYAVRSEGSAILLYASCIIERVKICKIQGKIELGETLISQAMEFCDKYDLKLKREKLERALVELKSDSDIADFDKNIKSDTKYKLETKGIEIYDIVDLTEKIGILNKLAQEREKISINNMWIKIINSPKESIKEIIEDSLGAIENNYGIDCCIYIKNENNKLVVQYSDSDVQLDDEKLNKIYNYYKKNPLEFAVSKMGRNFYDYDEIISIFNTPRIASFLWLPIVSNDNLDGIFILYMEMRDTMYSKLNKYQLNNENLSIFVASFRQFTDTLEKAKIHEEMKKVNEKLKDMALKDNLTGLYNRQGLNYVIENSSIFEESELCGIMYFDLDNFKYYNDNFGHDVGDLILVAFANVIRNICGEDGYSIRYGGDEFLVILSIDDKEEAEDAAKCIYNTIKKEDSFRSIVEKTIGKKVEIPEESMVTCSIGISYIEGDNKKATFKESLKKADDMLYYIKRTKKGRYKVWGTE